MQTINIKIDGDSKKLMTPDYIIGILEELKKSIGNDFVINEIKKGSANMLLATESEEVSKKLFELFGKQDALDEEKTPKFTKKQAIKKISLFEKLGVGTNVKVSLFDGDVDDTSNLTPVKIENKTNNDIAEEQKEIEEKLAQYQEIMDSKNLTYEREIVISGMLHGIDYDKKKDSYHIVIDETKIDSNKDVNLALNGKYSRPVILLCTKEYKKGKPTSTNDRKVVHLLESIKSETREVVHTLFDFDEEYNSIPVEYKHTTKVYTYNVPIGKEKIPIEVYKFSDGYYHSKYKSFSSIGKSHSEVLMKTIDIIYTTYFCVNSPTISDEQLGEVGKLERELLNSLIGIELINSLNIGVNDEA
jgi:hypothetical protein